MTSPQLAAASQTFGSYSQFYRNSPYKEFDQEHRSASAMGLSIFTVEQDAVDLIDPSIDEYGIWIGLKGRGVGEIDFGDGWQRVNFEPGWVDMQPANQACGFRTPALGLRRLSVPVALLKKTADEHGFALSAFDAVTGKVRRNPHAYSLIDRIWHVSEMEGPSGALMTDGLFLVLMGRLLEQSQGVALLRDASASDTRIVRVIDYIEAHFGEPLNIGELAAIARLSPGHFSRTFKATTGEPVWTYVQRRRCERAKEMLLTTQFPIAEIAYRCGFANQGHLTRTFGLTFGTTPSAARRSL